MFDIFEQPWTLLGAAVLVLLGILTFRSVCPEKRRFWQLVVPIAIAGAGFGLDLLVTTDLEKIHSVIRMAIGAAENEDCAAIERLLDSNYDDGFHHSRADLMAHCRRELNEPTLMQVKKRGDTVELSGSEATAELTVRARFEDSSRIAREVKRAMLISVELHLTKQPDGSWLIDSVEPLEVDTILVSWRGI
ncbi:MAG: hypothetical protein JW993_07710 [Sedimentisphaerales bacterium]|nr:hypothetical protein [Sedimentisphaerales bacterium]